MSTALAIKETTWTPEQLQLITTTIAKGASPDELKLFLYRCKNMGLDPLKPGQIHFVKYGTSPGTIVVGIEGFRSIAGRTGKLSGVSRGVLRDDKGKVTHGWAEVHRSDWKNPAREEVPLSEYNTGKGPWAKMPETMVKKVAEAAALRMAFPDVLGGVYESAEMDQAAHNPHAPTNMQPSPDEGIQGGDGTYYINFGQWKNRTIEEVARNFGPEKIADYISFLEGAAAKKNQPLGADALEFIKQAEQYLGDLENNIE